MYSIRDKDNKATIWWGRCCIISDEMAQVNTNITPLKVKGFILWWGGGVTC